MRFPTFNFQLAKSKWYIVWIFWMAGVVVGSVGANWWLNVRKVGATDRIITTRADFEAGYFNNIDSKSKEGEIALSASGTWGARVFKTSKVGVNNQTAIVDDGTYIYMLANQDRYFARYIPNEDRWETLATAPHMALAGSDMVILGDYIYTIFGSWTKEFSRYSISNNTWENLIGTFDLVADGASLGTDGIDIYLLRGSGTTDFWRYSVGGQSWSALTGPPSTIGGGANLVYDNGFFYTPRGYGSVTFYRYGIGGTWATIQNMPGGVGTNRNIDMLGTKIYVTMDGGTTGFYAYDVGTTSWSTLIGTPQTSNGVGVVGVGDSNTGFVYVFRGGGNYDFWKYNPRDNTFVGLVDLPNTFSTGSDLVYTGNNVFYSPRGNNSTSFYRYTIGGTWATMTSSIYNFNDDTKGIGYSGYLYFVVGSGSTAFMRYDPNTGVGGTWEPMLNTPLTMYYGAAIVGVGPYLYATRGALTRTFYRYTIGAGQTWSDAAATDLPDNAEASYGSRLATDGTDIYYITGAGMAKLYKYTVGTTTWSEISSLPFAPYYGSDMTYYNGKLYFQAGNLKPDYWEYTVIGGAWRRLPPKQTYGLTEIGPWAGGSLESDGLGVLYAVNGNSVTRFNSYTIDGTNKYMTDGAWMSNTMDMTYVANWSALNIGSTTPVGTGISWYTRTSADRLNWSSWLMGTGTSIGSPANRYLQIGTSLIASNDRNSSPILNLVTVSYVGDTGIPINPAIVTGQSQQVAGVGLTSGNSYNYQFPYFSWSGATDPETGIAGYWVYFGSGSEVDPGVSGFYQTGNSYTVSEPMSSGSYYLRLKMVDGVGNTSAAVTGFVYDYNGLSPPLNLAQTSSVEFGLGTTANVNYGGNRIRLKNKSGFWQQERLSSFPAGMYYGAMAYGSSTNKLYALRGYSTNTFYIYDLTTNIMSTGPTAPGTYYYTELEPGPSDNLYTLRGNNTSDFWRFNVGTTTWTVMTASPAPQVVTTGSALAYDGTRYMYVLRGTGDDAFYRFDTQTESWEVLANTDFNAPINQPNNAIGDGGDLAYDGSENLYAIQGGGRDGFAVYNLNAASWLVLPDLPVAASWGSRIAYDATSAAIYYIVGQGKTYFYKYDIGSQTWSELTETPVPAGAGSALNYVGGSYYFMPGNGSAALYKYNIVKNSWLVPTVGLFDGWWRGSDSRSFYYGADIIKGDGDNYYLARGYYDNLLVRYNATTGVATRMADAPFGFYVGSELVYDSTRNRIYTAGNIYYRKMYYYDIATDTWIEEASDPPPFDSAEGSSMIYSPVTDRIYWLRGGGNNTFRQFNPVGVATSKWTSPVGATTPATMQYGSDMVIKGDYIYALRGNNQLGAYRYGPLSVGGTWVDAAMTDLPTGGNIYNDGFVVDGGTNGLFACRGANTQVCYTYDLGTTTWTMVGSTLAPYIYQGGAAVSNGSDRIYVIAANGQLNTFNNGLYTYVIGSTDSAFEESGIYISPVHDLTAVFRFASLEVGVSQPNNTDVKVYTRTSADNISWADWVEASSKRAVGTTWSYKVNSSANRYIQVKLALTSGDGVYSPVVNDYTINYYQDLTPPTNPTILDGYVNSDMGATVVSGVWTNSTAPYFDWPSVGSSGAASDGISGSGVNGYYVYLGTGETANPVNLGTYTTRTYVTGTGLTSGQTYYVRIKTKDNANNVTSEVGTTFIYKFDGERPSNPSTITADPPGYTASNSFTFSWSGATDVDTGIAAYCYKTAAIGATESCTTETTVTGIQAYQTGTNTFMVRTKDNAGNYSSEYATAAYYYSSTAPSLPTNLRLTYPEVGSSNTVNEFAFAWDKPSTYYGQESGLRYYYAINEMPTANNVNKIGLSITYLSKGAYATRKGTNTLYVVAMDEAGNIDYRLYASIDFEASTSAPGIPKDLETADVSVKETKSWKLAVSWDTPTATGSGISVYKVYRSATASANCTTDFSKFGYVSSTTGLSYVDVGLLQQRYYYCVKACDSTNECSAVSDTVSLLPDGKWRVAPSLVASPSAAVKTKSAAITWSTNRSCNSFIKYGKTSGTYGEEVGSSDQISSHSISLTGLDPGTTYYYKALWTDEDGNTGESSELSLTTKAAPVVSAVKVTDLGLYSAYITFTLKNATKARVEYGKTINYGSFVSVTTATNESSYTVKLEDLAEGTPYHMRIVAEDEEANIFTSDDYTFETLPLPKLTEIKIQQVRGMPTATIRAAWLSNTGISSIITYYPVGRPEMARDQIVLTLSKTHEVIIKDLSDDTEYIVIIKGKDVAGNSCLPSEEKFKTSADMRSPVIIDLKVETSVSGVGQEARAQIVAYWDTDEPGTAQVDYGQGTGTDYPNKTQEDETLNLNHAVTITDLQPNQVYHLRVITKDKAQNATISYDNVVITPKSTRSAMDLVVDSLSKSFGFFSSLGEMVK